VKSENQIKKNLGTDGYLLQETKEYYFLYKIDSTNQSNEIDSTYEIFLPFQKRYLITKDKREYKNALIIDAEIKRNDSLNRIDRYEKVYKCDMYLCGSTISNSQNDALKVNASIGLSINPYPFSVLYERIGISINNLRNNDELNFTRHLVFYIVGNKTYNLVFGNQSREVNSTITSSTGAVSTNYQNVYDGLSLQINKKDYLLTYRIKSDQITFPGIPDSVIVGSSFFDNEVKGSNFFIFRNRAKSKQLFKIASLVTICPIDSVLIENRADSLARGR